MADAGKSKQSKFEMVIGAVDKLSGPFRKMHDAITKKTAGLRKLQGQILSLGKVSGFNKLVGGTQNLVTSLRNVGVEGKKLVGTITGVASKLTLALGGAGGGLFALAKSTADAGEEVDNAAKRAGVGIKTWQEYAHVASLVGVSNEEMQKSLQVVQNRAIKAFQGDKSAIAQFQALGIAVKNAKGEVRNADNLLMDLADKVQALHAAGESGKAMNLVQEVMGKDGIKLLPMLAKGSEEIRKMRGEAHDLGLVLDEADIAASGKFNDELNTVKNTIRGLGLTIGKEFLPVVTEITQALNGWLRENRALIQSKIQEWAAKLREIMPQIREGIGKVVDAVSTLSGWANMAAEKMGGWGNVLTGLAALMSGKFLLSILSVGKAFVGLGATMLATPFGQVTAAIAGIAAAAFMIYDNWEGISGFFKGLWQETSAAFDQGWGQGILSILANFNPVSLILKGMNELVAYFTGIDLSAAGSAIVDSIKAGIAQKWEEIVGWFREKVESLIGWMPDWMKEKMGLSGDTFGAASGGTGGAAEAPFAGAAGGGASPSASELAGGLTTMKSTHTEIRENVVRLEAPDGWGATFGGGDSRDVKKTSNGMLIGQANLSAS